MKIQPKLKIALVAALLLLPVVGNTATELGDSQSAQEGKQPIRILHWPYDVPCDAIQKQGEVWKQTKSIIIGTMSLRDNTFSHIGETAIWDRKCGGNET